MIISTPSSRKHHLFIRGVLACLESVLPLSCSLLALSCMQRLSEVWIRELWAEDSPRDMTYWVPKVVGARLAASVLPREPGKF